GNDRPGVVESLRRAEAITGAENPVLAPIVKRLAASDGKADLLDEVVAAVANKEARQLTPEDYGRASGMLEVIQAITPPAGRVTVVLPNGNRREFPEFSHEGASARIRDALSGWQTTFSLSSEQLAALLLGAVFSLPAVTPTPSADDQPVAEVSSTPQ